MSGPAILYHYTCADHGRPGIIRSGVIIPNWHPFVGAALAWFTTEADPDRQATGLGMSLTRCDRMAFRFTADPRHCTPWFKSWQRRQCPVSVTEALEQFGDPEHWWVSSVPVVASPDPNWGLRLPYQGRVS